MTLVTDRKHRRPSVCDGFFLGAILLSLMAGCARNAPERPTEIRTAPPPSVSESRRLAPRFRSFLINSPRELLKLREDLGADRFEEVLKLNRIDLRHARQGDTLVVPTAAEDWHELAPFPIEWKEAAELPKLVAVSLRVQAWAAYEEGRLLHWGPLSSGRRATPTFVGLYHTNWRQRERRSTFNGEWQLKWYINLHNWNGISFHQYDLPGYPDSHSCLRLSADDSEWIYYWCQSWMLSADQRTVLREGTPVIVFGEYAWGAPRPWKRLVEDPAGGRLSPTELAEALKVWRDKLRPSSDGGPGGNQAP